LHPEFLAGHSLGEYNALWVAQSFDFETGLRLVKRRAELMGEAPQGGMAAIVGLELDLVRELLLQPDLAALDLANLNTPHQHVLAGPEDVLARARTHFEARGGKFVRLDVSAACHSRYMGSARRAFEQFLAGFELQGPRVPVVANVTAEPYGPAEVKALLARQITSPVCWSDSVRKLMGIDGMRFEVVGDGDVLARMVAKIQRRASSLRCAALTRACATTTSRFAASTD
jgi:trans-AT polyketide synthase/acyltransferase/oxidoreductase domain-containing protein